jgi:hypothetical protein
MAYTATLTLQVDSRNTTTIENGTETRVAISHPYGATATSWANGTGASQINLAWQNTTAYNTTGTTLDLTALTGGTGSATFTAIKAMKIRNNSNTDTLVVGNAASVQFTPGFSAATTTVTLQPGAEWVVTNPTAAGWDCTTNKNLKLAASANTVNTTLILIGLD